MKPILTALLAAAIALGAAGCTRTLPDGTKVLAWQDPRDGFVRAPFRPTITCRTYNSKSPIDPGPVTRCY
jgi:hypothetical protein